MMTRMSETAIGLGHDGAKIGGGRGDNALTLCGSSNCDNYRSDSGSRIV